MSYRRTAAKGRRLRRSSRAAGRFGRIAHGHSKALTSFTPRRSRAPKPLRPGPAKAHCGDEASDEAHSVWWPGQAALAPVPAYVNIVSRPSKSSALRGAATPPAQTALPTTELYTANRRATRGSAVASCHRRSAQGNPRPSVPTFSCAGAGRDARAHRLTAITFRPHPPRRAREENSNRRDQDWVKPICKNVFPQDKVAYTATRGVVWVCSAHVTQPVFNNTPPGSPRTPA